MPSDGATGSFDQALEALARFSSPATLSLRIGDLERDLSSRTVEEVSRQLSEEGITPEMLQAAFTLKRMAGQINVLVHAIGLLVSLPYVLEPGEVIESLSLGAGNTGRRHDLETDRRIAEFKFIEWRGGAESIRQNSLFIDLFNLATTDTDRRRVLYLVGKATPLRFLGNRRAISSVLSRNSSAAERFRQLHGDRFSTVREYYASVKDSVEVVDLAEIVPGLIQLVSPLPQTAGEA